MRENLSFLFLAFNILTINSHISPSSFWSSNDENALFLWKFSVRSMLPINWFIHITSNLAFIRLNRLIHNFHCHISVAAGLRLHLTFKWSTTSWRCVLSWLSSNGKHLCATSRTRMRIMFLIPKQSGIMRLWFMLHRNFICATFFLLSLFSHSNLRDAHNLLEATVHRQHMQLSGHKYQAEADSDNKYSRQIKNVNLFNVIVVHFYFSSVELLCFHRAANARHSRTQETLVICMPLCWVVWLIQLWNDENVCTFISFCESITRT